MKILVTGFGSFLGHGENPAEKTAFSIQDEDTSVLILPVAYLSCEEVLSKAIQKERPNLILSFGLAASRETISLEKKAYNEMNSFHPDGEGIVKTGEPIVKNGKGSLSTSFDLEELRKHLLQKGIQSALSNDPGRYVCNEAYYLDLLSGVPSLFVHLPSLAKKPLEEDAQAAFAIKVFLISSIKRGH